MFELCFVDTECLYLSSCKIMESLHYFVLMYCHVFQNIYQN